MSARHLVVMAAGTGGHVIPGLAVAREMQSRGWSISWLGTPAGMENKLVPPSGIPIDTIGFSGLRGKGLLHTLTGGLRMLIAFWQCQRIIRARRANAVLGMGGYVCFPGGLMASLLNRPLVLVNADASLLMSNKALLPVADAVAFGFDGAAAHKVKQAVVTGNPVRAEIENLPAPDQRFAGRSGALRVLVVGGSLGAKVLNECVPQALALLDAQMRPAVTHQTGQANLVSVQAAYAEAKVDADVLPFIDDMARQQRLVAHQERRVGVDEHEGAVQQRGHQPAGETHVAAHAEHRVRAARADDALALPERDQHPQAAGQRVQQTLAAQAGEADRVDRDAARRHELVLHAGRRAEPADAPAARLHFTRDREPRDHVTPGAGRHHDEVPRAHARPPRISCRFSISTRNTTASAIRFIMIADPP